MKTSYGNDAEQLPLAAWQWCWALGMPIRNGCLALESFGELLRIERRDSHGSLIEGKYSRTAQNPKKHWTLSNIIMTLYESV